MISGTMRRSFGLNCCELAVTIRFELFGAHTPAVTKRWLSADTMAVLFPGACGMQSAGETAWHVGGAALIWYGVWQPYCTSSLKFWPESQLSVCVCAPFPDASRSRTSFVPFFTEPASPRTTCRLWAVPAGSE